MGNDIRLGKILGIEIYISYSWFFIFALVTFALSFGFFPQQFPDHSVAANVIIGLVASALFFMSLLFHELSHSMVGNRNGIPIKKITLFIFGGISQMSEEPKDPRAEFKMALAGPASSLFLAGAFFLLFRALVSSGITSEYFAAFAWLAEINLLLAIFNLAPGFPLDGGRVLRAAVWSATGDFERATNVAARGGQVVAFLLIGSGLMLFFRYGNLGGIWLMLIGWFLNQSAVGSFRQVMLQHTLADVSVHDIMSHDVKTASPDTTLEDLVNHYFLRHRFGRFPILAGDELLGIVTLHDIKDVPRPDWSAVTAGEIIEPIDDSMMINEDEPSIKALQKMTNENVGHLLVAKEGRLVGLVTRTDILGIIRVRGELDL